MTRPAGAPVQPRRRGGGLPAPRGPLRRSPSRAVLAAVCCGRIPEVFAEQCRRDGLLDDLWLSLHNPFFLAGLVLGTVAVLLLILRLCQRASLLQRLGQGKHASVLTMVPQSEPADGSAAGRAARRAPVMEEDEHHLGCSACVGECCTQLPKDAAGSGKLGPWFPVKEMDMRLALPRAPPMRNVGSSTYSSLSEPPEMSCAPSLRCAIWLLLLAVACLGLGGVVRTDALEQLAQWHPPGRPQPNCSGAEVANMSAEQQARCCNATGRGCGSSATTRRNATVAAPKPRRQALAVEVLGVDGAEVGLNGVYAVTSIERNGRLCYDKDMGHHDIWLCRSQEGYWILQPADKRGSPAGYMTTGHKGMASPEQSSAWKIWRDSAWRDLENARVIVAHTDMACDSASLDSAAKEVCCKSGHLEGEACRDVEATRNSSAVQNNASRRSLRLSG